MFAPREACTSTDGYTYKCTVPNTHFRGSALIIKNPTVSPHGDLYVDFWLSACCAVSDVYVIVTIMACTGEYVGGVAIGPKVFRKNQFWHACWKVPMRKLCLPPGAYYIAMDVGRRRERELHRQSYFVVRHSPVEAICKKKKAKIPLPHPSAMPAATSVHVAYPIDLYFEDDSPVCVKKMHIRLVRKNGCVAYHHIQEISPPVDGSSEHKRVVARVPLNPRMRGRYRIIFEFLDESNIVCASCHARMDVIPSSSSHAPKHGHHHPQHQHPISSYHSHGHHCPHDD